MDYWWNKHDEKNRLTEVKKHWKNEAEFKNSRMYQALQEYDSKPSGAQSYLVQHTQWEQMHGSGVIRILRGLIPYELEKKHGKDKCASNGSLRDTMATVRDLELLVDFMVKCIVTGNVGGAPVVPWYKTFQQYAGGKVTGGTTQGAKMAGRKSIGGTTTGGHIQGGLAYANLSLEKLQVVHHWARFVEVKAALLDDVKLDGDFAMLEPERAKIAAAAVGWAQGLQGWCNDAKKRKATPLDPVKSK